MRKLLKSIFNTLISNTNEKQRTGQLDQMYEQSGFTRSVFLAKAKKVAELTFEPKESLAKIYKFAEYLNKKEVAYKYSGSYWTHWDEEGIPLKMCEGRQVNVEGVVFASNRDLAFSQIEEKYMYEGDVYDGDFLIEEISVKQAKKERKVA